MRRFSILLLLSLSIISGPVAAEVAGKVVFVSGDVRVGKLRGDGVSIGTPIDEGDALQTGKDGHLYIKLVDRGVLILRPNSAATITDYKFHEDDPSHARLRIDVSTGVVRSVTGKWGHTAPRQFRMNTPVAALGVRGTDFTVFVAPDITRAMVTAGGIVMTPLGKSCNQDGVGPCEGASSAELFAGNPNLALQLTAGNTKPVLIDARQKGLHPDAVTPPLPQEEGLGQGSHAAAGTTPLESRASEILPTDAGAGAAAPKIVWGQWEALQDPATAGAIRDGRTMVAANGKFGLFRDANATMTMPLDGTASFRLANYDSFFQNSATKLATPAQISNANLSVDFGARTFSTGFLMQGGGLSTQVNAKGGLFPDGRFVSNVISSNASVSGALAGSSEAAFVFHKPVTPDTTAYGATYWIK